MRENYNKKTYCLVCNKEVDLIVKNIKKHYKDDIIDIEYDGKTVICPICGDEQYDDEIIRYNQEQIDKKYKEECEIISKEDIEKILENYNIGKKPLSLLLGYGEVTITRYLNGYVPTPKNSKILKKILNSPSDYYSILQKNKNNITEVAFKKTEKKVKKILGIDTNDDLIADVSKYIINNAEVTNMSLQKILYYVQVFFYVLHEKIAFTNKCSAWEYGPVFGSIYYKYKSFNNTILSDKLPKNSIPNDLKDVVDSVINYFGCFTGSVLVNFTHNEDPWIECYNTDEQCINNLIISGFANKIKKEYDINEKEDIKKYSEAIFKKLYYR